MTTFRASDESRELAAGIESGRARRYAKRGPKSCSYPLTTAIGEKLRVFASKNFLRFAHRFGAGRPDRPPDSRPSHCCGAHKASRLQVMSVTARWVVVSYDPLAQVKLLFEEGLTVAAAMRVTVATVGIPGLRLRPKHIWYEPHRVHRSFQQGSRSHHRHGLAAVPAHSIRRYFVFLEACRDEETGTGRDPARISCLRCGPRARTDLLLEGARSSVPHLTVGCDVNHRLVVRLW